MNASGAFGLGKGWTLNVNMSDKEAVLIVLGPQGQGAAWTCEAGFVRHTVLENFMKDHGPTSTGKAK